MGPMESALSNDCLRCEVELGESSLPRRCSECGLVVDAGTRVWRNEETWSRLALVYVTGGLLIGLTIAVLYRIARGHVPDPTWALLCAMLAPGLGLLFRRIVGGRITGRFVAVTPSGILVGTRGRPQLIEWSDVERTQDRKGVIRILRHSTAASVPVDDVFTNADEVAAFRDAVRRALRQAKSNSSQEYFVGQ